MSDESKDLVPQRDQMLQRAQQGLEEKNALVFYRPEDLQIQGAFYPVVTRIVCAPEDFHNLAGGVKMPKSYHTHKIAEAAGISFTENCGQRKDGDDYVGWAQGERRGPDGIWRRSPVLEYRFSPGERAQEDFLRDSQKAPQDRKYKNDVDKELHVLEYKKFASQRASTGAELRVVRYLAGIPTGFTQRDIVRAMMFLRYDVNTDALLENPDTRAEAMRIALGASDSLYGAKKSGARVVSPPAQIQGEVDPERQEAIPEEDVVNITPLLNHSAPGSAFAVTEADFALEAEKEELPSEKENKYGVLLDYFNDDQIKLNQRAKAAVGALLDKGPGATLEELEEMIQNVEAYRVAWVKAKIEFEARGGKK